MSAHTVYVVPLVVQEVSGNPATSAGVLLCLNTYDATVLRHVDPVLPCTVAGVPWCDMETEIHDVCRWRDVLPAAEGARLARRLPSLANLTPLTGLTSLNAGRCNVITDAVVQRLPSTLRHLVVYMCANLTPAVSSTHLSSLTSLNCGYSAALDAGLEALPPSLQELRMDWRGYRFDDRVLPAANFRHLCALRVLWWTRGNACDASVATLPPTLEVLDISSSLEFEAMSLVHLPRLRAFHAAGTSVTDATVATLPASLEELNLLGCGNLTPAVSFAHLRALCTLDLRATGIGKGRKALSPTSLPPSLVPLLGPA